MSFLYACEYVSRPLWRMAVLPRASPGQNSEAANPASRKRRLLGTRIGGQVNAKR